MDHIFVLCPLLAGDLPQQQWSDVFKESGPGDLGSGGSEPAVDILLYGPADAPSSSSSNTSSTTATAASACHTVAGRFTLKSTASCGPHKLLAAESFTASDVNFTATAAAAATGPDSGPGRESDSVLLLGLTDDVDCAVMTAAFSSSTAAAADTAAGATAAAGGGGGVGGGGSRGGLVLTHATFLPAIAYVVAGKTQKRHLLLGELLGKVGCAGWVGVSMLRAGGGSGLVC